MIPAGHLERCFGAGPLLQTRPQPTAGSRTPSADVPKGSVKLHQDKYLFGAPTYLLRQSPSSESRGWASLAGRGPETNQELRSETWGLRMKSHRSLPPLPSCHPPQRQWKPTMVFKRAIGRFPSTKARDQCQAGGAARPWP